MIPALPSGLVTEAVARALSEDLGGRGDVTTLATIPELAAIYLMGAGNGRSSVVVTTNNDVLVWGMNDQGNLGLGHLVTPTLEPTPLPGF